MNRPCAIHVYAILFGLLLSGPVCLANGHQEVDMKIRSVPTDWSITLIWSIPETMKGSSVLVIRKENGYPQSTDDGNVVYLGHGTKAVDKDLMAGTGYFYRFFLFNSKGEIVGWARYKENT